MWPLPVTSDVRGVTRPTPPSLVFKISAGPCLPTFSVLSKESV